MKVLIIQQKMIGDVLTTSVLFEVLKKNHPDWELHYLINSHAIPVVENNPFIDKLVLFTPETEKNKLAFFSFLKQIRKEKYDVVIDVYGKISSLLITLASKAETRIGYHKSHTSAFYTHSVKRLGSPKKKAGLALENRLRLLEPLDIPFEYTTPKILMATDEIQAGRVFLESFGLDLNRPVFMLSVLGSSPEKTYPLDYMAGLIDEIALKKPEAQLLFNYLPDQKTQARDIYERCRKTTRDKIHFEVYAQGLRNFLAVVHHCNALIGNEGGAINMAKALGIPTFAVFCPFINKQNWFGELEEPKNQAVHLSDFVKLDQKEIKQLKKDSKPFYLKLKPDSIVPKLNLFLENIGMPK